MEFLLAQSEASAIKPWLDLAVSYGIPLLVTILVIVLLWRYVPKFIDGSLEAQKTVPAAINGLTETLRQTRDTLRQGVDLIRDVKEDSAAARDDLDQLKKAVHHGAAAGEKLLLESGRRKDSDVIIELGAMKEAVGDQNEYQRAMLRLQRQRERERERGERRKKSGDSEEQP